jgi:hypothetical protein
MSVQTRLPLPPGAREWMPPRKARCASLDGFSLHANVLIHGNDRQGLEQLCLYGARGAISLERLEQRQDGRLAYRMRRPAPDGSTHLVLTPIALLRRLAALIPPPRVHHVRFHGVFGPAAQLRASVTALAAAEALEMIGRAAAGELAAQDVVATSSPTQRQSRLDSATLLKRVFRIDVLLCAGCGGRMSVVAFITDRKVSARILAYLGLPTRVPPIAKARAPPSEALSA